MTNQHPITPPPELVREWTFLANEEEGQEVWSSIATQAAQWGADQELEACCEWLSFNSAASDARDLRTARRPKPPSLKEQALEALKHAEEGWRPVPTDCDIIRRAINELPDN